MRTKLTLIILVLALVGLGAALPAAGRRPARERPHHLRQVRPHPG